MQAGKLGPILLCGLMIGPVLGSGIFILPPLVIEKAGQWAFPAWLAIMLINAAFAYVFGWLSVMYPGESGVTKAVEKAFSPRIKMLTSFYLIASVCIGPAAVLLTIGEYLSACTVTVNTSPPVIALAMIPLLLIIQLQRIRNIGTISFSLSSIGSLLLFSGGMLTLFSAGLPQIDLPPFSFHNFGGSMLLLFWIVVGWEVIGNYSNEIDKPSISIPRAVTYSVLAISLVEIAVAGGMQFGIPTGSAPGVSRLLIPIFGGFSSLVGGILVFGLCATTYLSIVGAVSRLLVSLAEESRIPAIFSWRMKNNAPIVAICVICGMHVIDLLLAVTGVVDLSGLVSFANAFFLSNSLICVLAGLRLFNTKFRKILAVILALALTVVLLQSSPAAIIAVILIALWTCFPEIKTRIARKRKIASDSA
ncbi:APC family permease [Desulfovibrio sp. UCD-KL4C]|uniref:APC family permease n=1 Tax=Desulfovibrio sp. UCD-KL4C TaxID=2578120 RepID=UPI0025B7EEA3|nr:amino acid permease [Desulfovibrio sp. UCD-KL4C]